ncbi:MAG: DUF2085 domain-containing protein [Chloroflexota bacterium]
MSAWDSLLFWLDAGVCSQIPTHSFVVQGLRLPLCARNLGLFTGFLLAACLASAAAPKGRPGATGTQFHARARNVQAELLGSRWLSLMALLPLAIDGANSVLVSFAGVGLYAPSNALRLATGLLAGLALGALVRPPLGRAAPWLAVGLGLLAVASPYLALASAGTLGALALAAAAVQLALTVAARRPAHAAVFAWLGGMAGLLLLAGLAHGTMYALALA